MKWITQILDVKDYTIKTIWNDGSIRMIDLESFLHEKTNNTFSSYNNILKKEVFETVKCDGTSIYWENIIEYQDTDSSVKTGSLDISPELLYELSVICYQDAV